MGTATKRAQEEKAQAIEQLRQMLKPGDTVYTILVHCSSSGMTRVIKPVIRSDEGVEDISWYVRRALGWRMHSKHDGVIVEGCGMDMGFHLVYALGWALFPEGGPACRHRNRDIKPGDHEPDGGYLLNQRWL